MKLTITELPELNLVQEGCALGMSSDKPTIFYAILVETGLDGCDPDIVAGRKKPRLTWFWGTDLLIDPNGNPHVLESVYETHVCRIQVRLPVMMVGSDCASDVRRCIARHVRQHLQFQWEE